MAAVAQRQQGTPLVKAKAAEKVVYELLKKNQKRRKDTPEFKPYILLKNTSTISMNGELVNLRYIKGHKSIFVHEQEEGNRALPANQLNNKKNDIEIINGRIEVSPNDSVKIKYLDMCSENADSEHRLDSIAPRFRKVTEDGDVKAKAAKQKLVETALELAKSADNTQILFHAKHLGILFINPTTGASRSDEAILVDYKQAAMDDPKNFIDSFNDMDLRVRYWLDRAVNERFIDVASVPSKAIYTGSKAEICPIPSGTDTKNIMDALFMFANKQAGADFLKQLRDKYS